MHGRNKKYGREKDLTSQYLSGAFEEDRVDSQERFSARSRSKQQSKMERTAQERATGDQAAVDLASLHQGEVVQVYSLFCDVEHEGKIHQCVVRKTLAKVSATGIVVGDEVRFRTTGDKEGVIEHAMPRRTVLTRTDSFNSREQQPIVANSDQMLIVAALRDPRPKWGLIDRMIVAAQGGGLRPVVCLNKIDLEGNLEGAREILGHYASMGIATVEASAMAGVGLQLLRELLGGKTTVLAGHSGVGKSSLINAIQPKLHVRIGAIQRLTDKGRHTTSSAQRYELDFGGRVVDTPGVKQFGLWGVTRDNLLEYFPDVEKGTAPQWRVDSYQRIAESL